MENPENGIHGNSNMKTEFALMALTAALDEHTSYLKKHISTMESLTKAIKQLETVIKKDINRESQKPSLQLKEAVKSFVDYNINPNFYHENSYLKLKSPSKLMYTDLVTPKPEIKDDLE